MSKKRASAGGLGAGAADAPACPAEAPDGVAAVRAPAVRGPEPSGPPSNARSRSSGDKGHAAAGASTAGASDGPGAEARAGTSKPRGETKRAAAGKRLRGGKAGEGPAEEGVGGTQVRVPAAARGVLPIVIDASSRNTYIPPEHTPISSRDTLPLVGDILPPDEDYPASANLTLSIDIDPPPELPEPGTTVTQPRLGRMHGRDPVTGHLIPHERDEAIAKQVAEWVACGAGDNEIAAYLGIRIGQLRKCYKFELENGKFAANMAVGGTILALAKAGVPDMSKFWAKARMGWDDKSKSDTNNDGLLNIHIHT